MKKNGNRSFLQLRLGLARSIWMYYSHPIRTRALAALYRHFIRPGDLCFDVGSHIGNHLAIWLRLGARVVALEPQPHCVRLLRCLYGRRPGATLLEQAVGETAGFQTLYISQRSPTLSSLCPDWMEAVKLNPEFSGTNWDLLLQVEVTTLDRLIEKYGPPVFCKIDVEGGELAVLRGLSFPLPALSFEYISSVRERALECLYRLNELGDYEYNWTRGEGRPLQSPIWLDLQEMKKHFNHYCGRSGSGDVYAKEKKNVDRVRSLDAVNVPNFVPAARPQNETETRNARPVPSLLPSSYAISGIGRRRQG